MRKLSKIEATLPERRRPGRPKKVFDSAKLERVQVITPATVEERIENLLILDAHQLDQCTARELVRILPQLLIMRRVWKAHFSEFGCLSCHRKKVGYMAGGLCDQCCHRILHRTTVLKSKVGEGRDLADELGAITRRLDVAQRLLKGDD